MDRPTMEGERSFRPITAKRAAHKMMTPPIKSRTKPSHLLDDMLAKKATRLLSTRSCDFVTNSRLLSNALMTLAPETVSLKWVYMGERVVDSSLFS